MGKVVTNLLRQVDPLVEMCHRRFGIEFDGLLEPLCRFLAAILENTVVRALIKSLIGNLIKFLFKFLFFIEFRAKNQKSN